MTEPLLAIPALVVILGAVSVVAVARGVATEARQLGQEVRRLGDLQPALVGVQRDLASFRVPSRRRTHR